jgi:hypothetical protein
VQYSLAGQARELEMGSLHVVACSPDDDGMELNEAAPKMFLGLLICQHRNKSDGNLGPINMKRLQEGLWKACKWASANGNATVHLPRIGATVPGTNWYSIERLIRGSLGKAHIESYVYYFARGGGGGGAGVQRRPSLSSSTSSLSSSSGNIKPPAAEYTPKKKAPSSLGIVDDEGGFPGLPATLPVEEEHSKPKPSKISASSASSSSSGKKIGLYRVGASLQQKIRNAISAQGDELCAVLDQAQMVITSQSFDADETLITLGEKGIQLVDARTWATQRKL